MQYDEDLKNGEDLNDDLYDDLYDDDLSELREQSNENLNKLREQFDSLGIDAIFLGMYNAFGNYSSEMSDIQYFSGFSGSNGRCFISKEKAIISVDGRYVKQANIQVNKDAWEIKAYPDTSIVDTIKEIIKPNETLGICLYSLKYNSYLTILELSKKLNFKIKLIDNFPLIQREKSDNKLILLNENDIGESINSRINKIKSKLNDNEGIIINDSSIVGWITGLRLSKPTITHSVIPCATVLITKSDNKPIVFCDLISDCDSNDFIITSQDNFETNLKQLNINTIKFNFATTYLYFAYILEKLGFNIVNDNSINTICSIKNDTEIRNQREGALLTSLAMIKVMALAEMRHDVYSEQDAADLFYETLKENDSFVDFSFDPISARGEHTAIVHYNHKLSKYLYFLQNKKLFLFDGGAHFEYSTTDMTRTVYIGYDEPSDELKKQYTLVLRSIIDFSMMKFPNNVKAYTLDAVARAPLWQHGYNYSFGTSHGVSAFGNVHEYPGISTNSNDNIRENMIITIEPGIYTNNMGIRMENMLLVRKSEYSDYNEFETINYVPFCRKLIIKEMLSNDEIKWLNSYHWRVKYIYMQHDFGSIHIQKWIDYNTKSL